MMRQWIQSVVQVGLSLAVLMILSGCATKSVPVQHSDRAEGIGLPSQQVSSPFDGAGMAGFTLNQSAEEVKKTIVEMGYVSISEKGMLVTIDQLIDPAVRQGYVGKTVALERRDSARNSMYQVYLKFNSYFILENMIIKHRITSENDMGLLQSYLQKYPSLVFQGSEDGENRNFLLNRTEKITNSNYHVDQGPYAFYHLNQLRTHQEEGHYDEVITFNAHDSSFAVSQTYK